ncbi:hypothetical protein K438DRAFT_1826188 [Mycena galopus ATCC 62051]|nr:hypothetical protein K438DRAFT_1826188 [Mycena galopus ATCC 62051]
MMQMPSITSASNDASTSAGSSGGPSVATPRPGSITSVSNHARISTNSSGGLSAANPRPRSSAIAGDKGGDRATSLDTPTGLQGSEAAGDNGVDNGDAGNEDSGAGSSANAGSTGVEGVGNGGGGDDNEPVDEVDPDVVLQQTIDHLWSRSDRAQWTGELGRAHAAFARGKPWGIEWARCVAAFFDFESAHGYSEQNARVSTSSRPRTVAAWLAQARQWDRTMVIGEVGAQGVERTWADGWWTWWASLQPPERMYSGGKLSRPEKTDWEPLVRLNGKNGLLQVMATLLWWGDHVGDGEDASKYVDWTQAVDDVAWTLRELEKSTKKKTGERWG